MADRKSLKHQSHEHDITDLKCHRTEFLTGTRRDRVTKNAFNAHLRNVGVADGVLRAEITGAAAFFANYPGSRPARCALAGPEFFSKSAGRTICAAGWYGPNYGAVAGDVGDQRCRRHSNQS
jgi:hypothetical protein